MSQQTALRALPSVDEVIRALDDLAGRFPRRLIAAEARRVLAAARAQILDGAAAAEPVAAVRAALEALARPSLRQVLNATGVVLHTNLGRAPLPAWPAPGYYQNLEYDLERGARGKRDAHSAPLLERLFGVPAIAVNNGAAAVFLALNELAAGGEVIVSRGELIEIGDGFRIPDIMARSGARLVEVGSTNRTRIADYREAITGQTRLLLRVHPSNFSIAGFTGKPSLDELCALARQHHLPVYEDLGSGCLLDLSGWGVEEPTIAQSLRAGVDLLSFSGDKLLGGPQAGLLAGRQELVQRLRRNPLFRALRLDKLQVAALETTLRHLLLEQWDAVPALRMIRLSAESIRQRAVRLATAIGGEVLAGESMLGGGSTPEQTLPTWLVALPGDAARLERLLRASDPPVIARIEQERLLLDLRTIAPEEEPLLETVLRAALAG